MRPASANITSLKKMANRNAMRNNAWVLAGGWGRADKRDLLEKHAGTPCYARNKKTGWNVQVLDAGKKGHTIETFDANEIFDDTYHHEALCDINRC